MVYIYDQTSARPRRWLSCAGLLVATAILGGGCTGPNSERSDPLNELYSKHPSAREPKIRVLLMEGVNSAALEIQGPYRIVQHGNVLLEGKKLAKSKVTTVSGQPDRLMVGQLVCAPGPVQIMPKKRGSLRLYFASSGSVPYARRYDGFLSVLPRKPSRNASLADRGQLDVINVVGLESYLIGVLNAELYPFFHLETFKAQAIVARTYALYEMRMTGKSRRYDVRATEKSQVYKGLEGFSSKSKAYQAVRSTAGIVCTWKSPGGPKIFSTYYSSACGGVTQDVSTCMDAPSIPPLSGGVRCNYCSVADTKYQAYRWKPVRISKSEVTELFIKAFPEHTDIGFVQAIRPIKRSRDGRPIELAIIGANGKQAIVRAYDFRLALGGHRIRSTDYKLVDEGDVFVFTEGKGFGHGIGLCQWGAEGRARQQIKAAEIVPFYYPGSSLTRAY